MSECLDIDNAKIYCWEELREHGTLHVYKKCVMEKIPFSLKSVYRFLEMQTIQNFFRVIIQSDSNSEYSLTL